MTVPAAHSLCNSYEGGFVNNQKHGFGILTFTDGAGFAGQFEAVSNGAMSDTAIPSFRFLSWLLLLALPLDQLVASQHHLTRAGLFHNTCSQ